MVLIKTVHFSYCCVFLYGKQLYRGGMGFVVSILRGYDSHLLGVQCGSRHWQRPRPSKAFQSWVCGLCGRFRAWWQLLWVVLLWVLTKGLDKRTWDNEVGMTGYENIETENCTKCVFLLKCRGHFFYCSSQHIPIIQTTILFGEEVKRIRQYWVGWSCCHWPWQWPLGPPPGSGILGWTFPRNIIKLNESRRDMEGEGERGEEWQRREKEKRHRAWQMSKRWAGEWKTETGE